MADLVQFACRGGVVSRLSRECWGQRQVAESNKQHPSQVGCAVCAVQVARRQLPGREKWKRADSEPRSGFVLTGSRRKRAAAVEGFPIFYIHEYDKLIIHAVLAHSFPVGPFGSSERGAGWSARHDVLCLKRRSISMIESAVSAVSSLYIDACVRIFTLSNSRRLARIPLLVSVPNTRKCQDMAQYYHCYH